MILSLIEYGNTVYAGTSNKNLDKLDKLFYRGLRICDGTNTMVSRLQLRNDCHIDELSVRRNRHLLLFMYKQTKNKDLIKKQMFALGSIRHLCLKLISLVMKKLGKISCIEAQAYGMSSRQMLETWTSERLRAKLYENPVQELYICYIVCQF